MLLRSLAGQRGRAGEGAGGLAIRLLQGYVCYLVRYTEGQERNEAKGKWERERKEERAREKRIPAVSHVPISFFRGIFSRFSRAATRAEKLSKGERKKSLGQ